MRKVLRLLSASLALAASGLAPLSAATALPTVNSLLASAKDSAGRTQAITLKSLIEAATTDPVQRAQLAKALADAAVQLANTDPKLAAVMVAAATDTVGSRAVASAAPEAALAIGNAALNVAKNPAVLANFGASGEVRNAVINAARIARNLAGTPSAAAALTLAQDARTAAIGVDTARGTTGGLQVVLAVENLTSVFNTSQGAIDASASGRGGQ